MPVIQQATDNFRDRTASLEKDGARKQLFPRQPHGRYYTARTIVSVLLLAFLFTAPFIHINGLPLMMFNILERRFIFFGLVFLPQDFYLVVLGALTLLVSVFLFTAIFGRVWCGWLCPQTVFLEMLFRRIEYLIEGDARQQRKLSQSPMTPAKFLRKAAKLAIFWVLSFAIANTFLAYIIGAEELRKIVTAPPSQHLTGFIAINIFTFLFFGVFAWFREQACVVVCPYGRYQSALVDQNTIVVTYDFRRGEPRGKLVKIDSRRQTDLPSPERGDCVDCYQCVEVCPTGIDIRDGIQLECVNCTACMDACDHVMDKIKKPRGLIRYTSLTAVREGRFRWLSPRILGYAGVWVVISSLFLWFFLARSTTEVMILRQPGMLSTQQANGEIANFYVLQIANKQAREVPVELKLLSPQQGTITPLGDFSVIPRISVRDTRFILALPGSSITSPDMNVRLGVYSNGVLLREVETRFLTIRPEGHHEEKESREHSDHQKEH